MATATQQLDPFQLEVTSTDGNGDTVFLFHGNSSSTKIYQALLQSPLAEEYRLIAVNWPGHGQSTEAN